MGHDHRPTKEIKDLSRPRKYRVVDERGLMRPRRSDDGDSSDPE